MSKFKKQPKEYDPKKDLLNEQLIAEAIWECLKENDPDGVIEILEAHLSAKNKIINQSHQTFKSKNPTLHTLAKFVHTVR